MKRVTVVSLTLLILSSLSYAAAYADLYSGGPWRGRVIDADTKQPIEGAVVALVWNRVYDCGVGRYPYFQKASEVLTDKTGSFEIPAYVEKRSKSYWKSKDLEGDLKAGLICSGPTIRDPEFIIYKPLYGNFPQQDELRIYAIGPNTSIVEYQQKYKGIYKGHETEYYKRERKEFPEGLVYNGRRCQTEIVAMKKMGLFISMKDAKRKLENLAIPLDCPQDGESVPSSMHGFRDDVENQYPVIKGGYIIIELPKLRTKKERMEAIPMADEEEAGRDELPILHKVIDEEENYLRSH